MSLSGMFSLPKEVIRAEQKVTQTGCAASLFAFFLFV